MNCKHCNKTIPNDSKFCPYCGGENSCEESRKSKFPQSIIGKCSTLRFLLLMIGVGIWIIVFQNLGVIPITQNVKLVDVETGTSIGIRGSVDANLQYINGRSDVFFNNPSRGENDKYYVIPVSVE